MGKSVHVVGTAGEAETLVALLARLGPQLGIGEVSFHKRSLPASDAPRVRALADAGALPCAEGDTARRMVELGLGAAMEPAAALARAAVVVDATPQAAQRREQYAALEGVRGGVALRAATGFGAVFAQDVNQGALTPGTDRFLRVATSGAQAMAALVSALAAGGRVERARFVHLRCAADVGTAGDFLASPVLARPECDHGTADAEDARALLASAGLEVDLHASAVDMNTALLDALHFRVELAEPIDAAQALARLQAHPPRRRHGPDVSEPGVRVRARPRADGPAVQLRCHCPPRPGGGPRPRGHGLGVGPRGRDGGVLGGGGGAVAAGPGIGRRGPGGAARPRARGGVTLRGRRGHRSSRRGAPG